MSSVSHIQEAVKTVVDEFATEVTIYRFIGSGTPNLQTGKLDNDYTTFDLEICPLPRSRARTMSQDAAGWIDQTQSTFLVDGDDLTFEIKPGDTFEYLDTRYELDRVIILINRIGYILVVNQVEGAALPAVRTATNDIYLDHNVSYVIE